MTESLGPRIAAKLDSMASRVEELAALTADPAVLKNPERLKQVQKELGPLQRHVTRYEAYRKLEAQIADNRSLMEPGGDAGEKFHDSHPW